MDCDAFYASVEKRDRPELRDKPVIVGGGKRGVVTTAAMWRASTACARPCRCSRPGRPARTRWSSSRTSPSTAPRASASWASYRSSRPWCSRCRWTRRGWTCRAPSASTAARPRFSCCGCRRRSRRETGLSVSIGLAPNKFLAKIASELDKPRGFTVIGAAEAKDFLASKPVSILPGVGPAFARTLASDGFATVGDLARAEPKDLVKRYGEYGLRLSNLAAAKDARAVDPDSERKGMSAETTFNEDLRTLAELEDELWPLCDKLARPCPALGRRRSRGGAEAAHHRFSDSTPAAEPCPCPRAPPRPCSSRAATS